MRHVIFFTACFCLAATLRAEDTVEVLTKKISSDDGELRLEAVKEFGNRIRGFSRTKLKDKGAVQQMLVDRFAKEPDAAIQVEIIRAISGGFFTRGVTQTEKTLTLLKAQLKHKSFRVRAAAAYALGGKATPETIKLLDEVARSDPHDNVRENAARAIGNMRTTESREAVAKLAADGELPTELRVAAVAGLANSTSSFAKPADQEPVIAALADLAKDGNRHVRAAAVSRLASRVTRMKSAAAPFLAAFDDKDGLVRTAAVNGVRYWKKDLIAEHKVSSKVIAAIVDPTFNVRQAALYCAPAITTGSDDAMLKNIGELLTDSHGSTRSTAVYACQSLGKRAKPLLPKLEAMLKSDDNKFFKSSIQRAIKQIAK